MTKNTSVTASATFDQMPRPNQSRNSGASTTRGIAFSMLMYGSRTRASIGDRASANPRVIPNAAPTSSPSSDSSSVTDRWRHRLPPITQLPTRRTMSVGRLTKKGSSSFSDTSPCQRASASTPTTICQKNTAARLIALTSSTAHPHLPLTFQHLAPQHTPQRPVQIDEGRRRAQLHHVAWAIERHAMTRDDAARGTSGKHNDFVSQRDRFFEIVSDEENGLARGLAEARHY